MAKQIFTALRTMKSRKSNFDADLRIVRAEGWFRDLRTRVHNKIDRERKSLTQVRVAHLDTGIDFNHNYIKDAVSAGKIKGYKGFPDSLMPLNDRNGHGTHGVSTLLRTAPNAIVFVARVVRDDGTIPDDDDYAQVAKVMPHDSG